MKNLIAQGIAQRLIRLEDNNKYIVYAHQNKRRNFNIRNLMIHRYLDLPVSLPPMEEQAKIVAEVQSLQSQATALRLQAVQKLDAAKAQVEHLIFGST